MSSHGVGRTLFLAGALTVFLFTSGACGEGLECRKDSDCVQDGHVCKAGVCKLKKQPDSGVADGGGNADAGAKDAGGADCVSGKTRPCYSGPAGTQGVGICKAGTQRCVGGRWSATCEGEVLPAKAETCDGKDDDCDGKVDEEAGGTRPLERPCYNGPKATRGVGECKDGKQTCKGGTWSACAGEVLPAKAESCNGKDDDCDGKVDEEASGVGVACTAAGAKGACAKGKTACSGGKMVCQPGKPGKPVCPGLIDADCDGRLDCEVRIPAETFSMGSPSSEAGRESDEGPRTKVTLTNRFAMWKYEVTQGQFKSLMGYNPSKFSSCGVDCPVEQVNWHEAVAFCNALSKKRGLSECFDCKLTSAADKKSWSCSVKAAYQGNSGKDYYKCQGYRLPTEAEWEYAYRAGTTTAFHNGKITSSTGKDPNLEKIGWYKENSGSKTHPVGKKQANAWGLYDMAGNVYEWVYDWYAGKYPGGSVSDPVGPASGPARVNRGGGWYLFAGNCRAANRAGHSPGGRDLNLGFRACRSE